MSLLESLINSKPVRIPLEFGIQENVRLISISNEKRISEGEVISRNTFLTFAKYDLESNEKVGQTEFSYFNLDHTSDFVLENLSQQLGHLNNIVNVLVNTTTGGNNLSVDPFVKLQYSSIDEVKSSLRTKKGCEDIMEAMWQEFSSIINDFVGEKGPLLRIKIVTDSKGKYLQLPKDATFLQSMEVPNSLSISPYEMKNFNKGTQPEVVAPDNAATNTTKKKSIINML